MARYARGLIAASLVLLAIGAYSLYASNISNTYKSTFNLLPLRYFRIPANLGGNTEIRASYSETSARHVNFDIMSSVQFAAFQARLANDSLYSISESATGKLSFTTTAQDTYYLVFRHGVAYKNTTETVTCERTYIHPDILQVVSGVILVSLAVVEGYWGFRPRKAKSEAPATQTSPERYW